MTLLSVLFPNILFEAVLAENLLAILICCVMERKQVFILSLYLWLGQKKEKELLRLDITGQKLEANVRVVGVGGA